MSEEFNVDNLLTYEEFVGVSRRIHYNQFIGDFYERMASENEMPIGIRNDTTIFGVDENLSRIAKRIKSCSRNWIFDFYKKAKIKNLVRVERCNDRFCLNCQSLLADQRFAQYGQVLEDFTETHDVYHVVLTVPNVDASRLLSTIDLMLYMFGDRFIRYFNGSKKIRGVDFEKYGYIGAVRALEITTSKYYGTFHPHLHCMFILKKGLDMSKVYWNRFSEDRYNKRPTRLFSSFELLIQRIWALLILKIKVTKESIENIGKYCDYPDGFTCTADFSNHDYHEIFKYAIKGTFKNETLFTYESFLTLYKALFKKRAYQTYGCLSDYDFNDVDEDLGLNSLDEMFDMFIRNLQLSETPERIEEILATILKNTLDEKFKYVSKATFTRHFKALQEEEKLEVLKKLMMTLEKKESSHCEQLHI